MDRKSELSKKILEEMTVDYSNSLDKNFDLAKQFVQITKDGKVDLKEKEKLTGKDKILLYLVGKLYAKEAGLAQTDSATNQELMDELGIQKGSLQPWLKELRESNRVKQVKFGKSVQHSIPINNVESTLLSVQTKIKGR